MAAVTTHSALIVSPRCSATVASAKAPIAATANQTSQESAELFSACALAISFPPTRRFATSQFLPMLIASRYFANASLGFSFENEERNRLSRVRGKFAEN